MKRSIIASLREDVSDGSTEEVDRPDHSKTDAGAEHEEIITEAVTYGSLGGFVATLSMTVFRMPTSKSLPPTAEFWAKFVGSGEPEEYPAIALVLHFLYGIGSGVMFALISPGRSEPDEIAESKGALLGTVYGTVLSIFGARVVLSRILDLNLDTDELLVFHISHVVYGLTLGTWVGSRFANEG